MKSHGGMADVTFVPGRVSPLVDEGNPGGVKFAFPDIEVDRDDLDPRSQGFFEVAHERCFQPGDLPPDKSATAARDEYQNHQNSKDHTNTRAIHA